MADEAKKYLDETGVGVLIGLVKNAINEGKLNLNHIDIPVSEYDGTDVNFSKTISLKQGLNLITFKHRWYYPNSFGKLEERYGQYDAADGFKLCYAKIDGDCTFALELYRNTTLSANYDAVNPPYRLGVTITAKDSDNEVEVLSSNLQSNGSITESPYDYVEIADSFVPSVKHINATSRENAIDTLQGMLNYWNMVNLTPFSSNTIVMFGNYEETNFQNWTDTYDNSQLPSTTYLTVWVYMTYDSSGTRNIRYIELPSDFTEELLLNKIKALPVSTFTNDAKYQTADDVTELIKTNSINKFTRLSVYIGASLTYDANNDEVLIKVASISGSANANRLTINFPDEFADAVDFDTFFDVLSTITVYKTSAKEVVQSLVTLGLTYSSGMTQAMKTSYMFPDPSVVTIYANAETELHIFNFDGDLMVCSDEDTIDNTSYNLYYTSSAKINNDRYVKTTLASYAAIVDDSYNDNPNFVIRNMYYGTTVNIPVSIFENDKKFQTEDEVTTAIKNAIGDITGVEFKVVESLPDTGDAGTIYLVAHSHGDKDIYDEYIYVNSAWEKIGSTDIDLSDYLTTEDVQALTSAEVTTLWNNTSAG